MATIFSEFVIDGVTGDIYDKAALHEEDLDGLFDDAISVSVKNQYSNLGADVSGSGILAPLFAFIGNTIGAAPSTLATTAKTLVGAINELKASITAVDNRVTAEHDRIHISTSSPTASDGADGDVWIKYTA